MGYTITHTFSANTLIQSAQMNTNFQDGETWSATAATLTGAETLTNKILTSPDINGGTVDGATIGASSASTGAFTTLSASSSMALAATKRQYFDGVGGVTSIYQPSANHLTLVAGSTGMTMNTTLLNLGVHNLQFDALKRFYRDGTGNTYDYASDADHFTWVAGGTGMTLNTTLLNLGVHGLRMDITKKVSFSSDDDTTISEASANNMQFETGGVTKLNLDSNSGATGGSGSAGAGNQYVELKILGSRYKLLHDGTV